MTAPALDRLRDEIADAVQSARVQLAYGPSSTEVTATMLSVLTRHITADVLAGLLDGTMVAVPNEPTEAMLKAGSAAAWSAWTYRQDNLDDEVGAAYRAMLAAAKPEDRA